ncbi:hypothetical protein HHI36_018501 [Cryptolaemus montrouzieri]|uniref:Uncharacterized protein n=1 Tax=Cryptolaemus montrouzieri TaxID=559131 RepID=A0ABD2P103_9CUCU
MHAAKRTAGAFNAVGCDLALEQSQNRSSAVTGGLIGITKNEGAMQRWLLLYPFKSSIHSMLTSYLGIQSDSPGDSNSHSEWTQSRINTENRELIWTKSDVEFNIVIYLGNVCFAIFSLVNKIRDASLMLKKDTLLTTYENERFVKETKKLSDPIQKTKF